MNRLFKCNNKYCRKDIRIIIYSLILTIFIIRIAIYSLILTIIVVIHSLS